MEHNWSERKLAKLTGVLDWSDLVCEVNEEKYGKLQLKQGRTIQVAMQSMNYSFVDTPLDNRYNYSTFIPMASNVFYEFSISEERKEMNNR